MATVSQVRHSGKVEEPPPLETARPSLSVVIEDEAGGTFRARLVVQGNAPPGVLANLPAQLRQQGFNDLFADVWQGQHVLVASGLTKNTQHKLLNILQEIQLLQPDGVTYNVRSGAELMKENLRRDALKWGGGFAVAADLAMISAGMAQPKKDWGRILNGVGFAGAQSLMTIYGNGKGEIDFDGLFRDMNTHMKQNGMELPMVAGPEQRKNFIGHINDYLKKHSVDLVFGLGAISNIGNIRSGIVEYGRSGTGISRALYGTGSAATSAGVVLLPEKKRNEKEQEPRHEFSYYLTHPLEAPAATVNYVLESPIRSKGIYSAFNSTLHLFDSRGEFAKMQHWATQQGGKDGGQSYMQKKTRFDVIQNMPKHLREQPALVKEASKLVDGMAELKNRELFAKSSMGKLSPYLTMAIGVGYLTGSIFVAFSSRHRDKSFEQADEYEKMYSLAAQTVLPFPTEQRPDILKQMATYLSTQEDVKAGDVTVDKIMSEVSSRLEKLEHSPWLATHAPEKTHRMSGSGAMPAPAYAGRHP